MRRVIWTDNDGWKHCSVIRDSDPDEIAPSGIPHDPPDLSRLDWEGIQKELHNILVDKGLCNWEQVVASQNGVTASILSVMKSKVLKLYSDSEDTR
jgi:hypothetical protein